MQAGELGKLILHIPDAHAKPDVENDRFDWLGRFIADIRPDKVIETGDFADLESLSLYDKGKRTHEGRRLKADIEAAVDARQRLTAPLRALQEKQRQQKIKVYNPELIALGGNHEYRIDRLMDSSAEFYGLYSQDVSDAAGQGWRWYRFKEIIEREGILWSHWFPSGRADREISGEKAALKIIKKMHKSCVSAHSHLFDYAEDALPHGERLLGLVGGCYFQHREEWAGNSNNMYRRGVSLLHNTIDGVYDIQWISIEAIKHNYRGNW